MRPGSLNLMKLLHGERVSKPPFWEVWFTMFDFCRRNYGDFSVVENRINMALDLGMDAVLLGFVNTNVHFLESAEASDGTEHYDHGTLSEWSQIEERGPAPDWSEQIIAWKSDRQKIEDSGLACWMILPWCFHAVATSMGLENLAVKCYDDFNFVKGTMTWVEERNRIAIERVVAEVKPDFVLFDGDCAYKNGLMVRPSMFRELVYDITRGTVAELKKLSIPYTFHSDGKMDDFTPILIELGFSAVHGCEKAANDLDDIVHRFGDDICLVGNMDVVFLSRATPEEVRKETESMLKSGSRKGRFMAACNTSPQDYIPEENYRAMADTIRNF